MPARSAKSSLATELKNVGREYAISLAPASALEDLEAKRTALLSQVALSPGCKVVAIMALTALSRL
jgi:hypothetical protein